MATKIEWVRNTDGSNGKTWNPTLGCSKKSPGCRNCYAIRVVHRLAGNPNPKVKAANQGLTVIDGNGNPNWTGVVRLIPDRLDVPLRTKKPTTFFVNSLSDLFHESLPDEAIDQVFAVMALCAPHTFQVLTKTPDRMLKWFDGINKRRCGYWCEHGGYLHDLAVKTGIISDEEAHLRVDAAVRKWKPHLPPIPEKLGDSSVYHVPWPLPNVWLGVSAENQQYADERIPLLLKTPAAVRFVSAEPLLGPIDLRKYLPRRMALEEIPGSVLNDGGTEMWTTGLDWVIAGGESGHGARPMHPEWARSLRDHCQAAGVAFFFKQWGEWFPVLQAQASMPDWKVSDPKRIHLFDDGDVSVRISKKLDGRMLDGRTWDELPESRSRA